MQENTLKHSQKYLPLTSQFGYMTNAGKTYYQSCFMRKLKRLFKKAGVLGKYIKRTWKAEVKLRGNCIQEAFIRFECQITTS